MKTFRVRAVSEDGATVQLASQKRFGICEVASDRLFYTRKNQPREPKYPGLTDSSGEPFAGWRPKLTRINRNHRDDCRARTMNADRECDCGCEIDRLEKMVISLTTRLNSALERLNARTEGGPAEGDSCGTAGEGSAAGDQSSQGAGGGEGFSV